GSISAVHLAWDWLRGNDGRGLLLQLRQMVLERLRLRLERFQVDLDLRKEQVEGVDEGDGRAGVRDVGAGFRQEGDDVDVAPPTFVQEDARHAGDHARLELLDPALLEFGPRAVRAADAPNGRFRRDRRIRFRGQTLERDDPTALVVLGPLQERIRHGTVGVHRQRHLADENRNLRIPGRVHAGGELRLLRVDHREGWKVGGFEGRHLVDFQVRDHVRRGDRAHETDARERRDDRAALQIDLFDGPDLNVRHGTHLGIVEASGLSTFGYLDPMRSRLTDELESVERHRRHVGA